ncbi:MAG TPA: hypothetical protein PLH15_05320 [Spirochaetota bacterium]|nr:hypothetical protein [Spirochaetota bacterium]HQO22875.1 hypothetical protein [Spirochaetota bacterium]HQQ23241.1 hypothetical protein [Spirochaetota bacterium]
MRSKKTNYLQVCILITGFLFVLVGLIFFISPALLGKCMSIDVGEDWISQMRLDEFLVLITVFAQSISLLMFFAGISMVMPLFDPLKYRALVYFFGVFFPVSSSLFAAFKYLFSEEKQTSALILSLFFLSIAVLNISGLFLTKKDAAMGVE